MSDRPVKRRVVAFDLRSATGQPTGVGKHLLSIAVAAADENPDIEVRAYVSDGRLEPAAPFEVVSIPQHGPIWHMAVWCHLRSHPVSAYISTSLVVPSLPGMRALPVVLDMASFRVPQYQARRTRLFEHALMRRVVTRHPVIFGSQAAADDCLGIIPGARGVIVPPWFPAQSQADPPDAGALTALGIDGPYALMVGTVEPRKNVLMAARVVASLREQGRDLRLVIVGRRGWATDDEIRELEALVRDGTVVWPGYVTDSQRDGLYQTAALLLMPSAYEGFGMPLVEAMAAGVPCLCSTIPAFAEVGRDAVLRLDPARPDQWVAACGRILDDPDAADKLRRAGLTRAATYTRERTAQSFALALRQLS